MTETGLLDRTFYGEAYLVREARRDLTKHSGERRGRSAKLDGDAALTDYIEIEARAIIIARGNLSKFLKHPRLRISVSDADRPSGVRLDNKDRERLRKRHQIGQREVRFWRDMRCRYGRPCETMVNDTVGEPHPIYFEIARRIEDRVAELRADDTALFFSK